MLESRLLFWLEEVPPQPENNNSALSVSNASFFFINNTPFPLRQLFYQIFDLVKQFLFPGNLFGIAYHAQALIRHKGSYLFCGTAQVLC